MIERLTIENFQSHQDTTIALDPGVNAFTGNSDCGKSAVIRALLWAVTNSPSGDAFVSDWAKDGKGRITFPCRVSVTTDGQQVTRERGSSFNGYRLGDTKFEALRTDVPQEVQDAFGLDKVNVQRQLDGLFMLSQTPGERARYVNELVRLEDIDRVVSAVTSLKRETEAELKTAANSLDKNRAQLEAYSGLDRLNDMVDRMKSIEDAIRASRALIQGIDTSMETYERSESMVNSLQPVLRELTGVLESAGRVSENIDRIIPIANLGREIDAYERTRDMADKLTGILDKVNLSRAERISRVIVNVRVDLDDLSRTHGQYVEAKGLADYLPTDIKDLEDELSKMACPLCGRLGHNHKPHKEQKL